MGLTTLPRTASVEEAIAVMERDGGVIIEDFVDSATLAGIKADLDPYLEAGEWGQDTFSGHRTRRLGGLYAKSTHAAPLVEEEHFLAAAEHFLLRPTKGFLGEEPVELVPTFQIGVTQVIKIYPGEGKQALHRDDGVFQWTHEPGYGQARVQIMLAVEDFTEENGATNVVPGSHLWPDDRAPKREEAVSAVMKAGSALIWLGGTYHGGGENTAAEATRTGITIGLDLGYLRQEENQYLAVPLETAKTLPLHVQRLLGYSFCPPTMGWIEVDGVMADPHIVLEDEPVLVNATFNA
ncbi:phytanoyl-CoA dioxygenase family protein [Nocardioides sp. GY 10127]|uniref:phytanoyl-CoA dioxygenase family protein n=1 Tax=Nocardioides sp. GY 10127 TaxID=2569762 RepID=UPI0010A8B061|nr:phytanoyl-CoA dioxygenase family protein [Nocardioides sp. GY 10127]TIC79126.1 phytanoyl-CoA dioxygenase family protein [Nocardioides sp. GY 10127]